MSLLVDIHKNLGDFQLDVSFEADEKVVGLLGASGSGKSLTLRCIAGVETPDRGRIVLDGVTLFDSEKRVNLPPQKRQIGYMFQSYSLFPNMTVQQNILCGMRRVGKKERPALLRRIMENMQLTGLEAHYPHQLSGGQQQRVALARIMVGDPKLLLLDEPFSALDTHLRGQMQIYMQQVLKSFDKNVLLVTHSRTEAYHFAGKIVLVDGGRVLAYRGTQELFDDPGTRQAARITGCKNIVDAQKAGEYEVEIPQWGLRLTTAQPVRDGLCAVAIRAHHFRPDVRENRLPIQIMGEMEK